MNRRFRFLHRLGKAISFLGMMSAIPGAYLILAGEWLTDTADEHSRDYWDGRF